MDVGSIVRALVGAQQTADKKLVELRAGQVVRGVLMQMLTESEGLVNILGTAVRARLETPLAQGQSTLLQVQPESANGTVVLKPLASSSAEIAPESMPEVLKSFGLKDTPIHRAIVRGFHQEGTVLTKELAKEASAALREAAPQGDETAVKAAVVAAKRGLPLTAATVGALRTAMFGDGLSELLNRVAEEARAFAAASSSSASVSASAGGGGGGGSQQLAVRTISVLENKDAIVSALLKHDAGAGGGGKPPQAALASAISKVSTAPAPAQEVTDTTGVRTGSQSSSQTGLPMNEPDAAAAAAKSAGSAAAGGKPPMLALLQLLGVDLEKMASKPSAPAGASAASVARLPEGSAQGNTPLSAISSAVRTNPAAGGTAIQQPADKPQPPLQQTSSSVDGRSNGPAQDSGNMTNRGIRTFDAARDVPLNGTGALGPAPDADAMPDRPAPSWTESLKATLLQLQGADDVPPALKEAAQQAVQWITGQQLLLSTERGNPFVYATMFVPFGTPGDGSGGNASVHIQTRKGKRGEWDADNCRLWFDLRLARIGDTCIDVQVTNKLVSLNIYNDTLDSLPWLEENKAAIEASLEGIGYRLASARTSPIPAPPAQTAEPQAGGAAGFRRSGAGASALFGGAAYKGVDVRV